MKYNRHFSIEILVNLCGVCCESIVSVRLTMCGCACRISGGKKFKIILLHIIVIIMYKNYIRNLFNIRHINLFVQCAQCYKQFSTCAIPKRIIILSLYLIRLSPHSSVLRVSVCLVVDIAVINLRCTIAL